MKSKRSIVFGAAFVAACLLVAGCATSKGTLWKSENAQKIIPGETRCPEGLPELGLDPHGKNARIFHGAEGSVYLKLPLSKSTLLENLDIYVFSFQNGEYIVVCEKKEGVVLFDTFKQGEEKPKNTDTAKLWKEIGNSLANVAGWMALIALFSLAV